MPLVLTSGGVASDSMDLHFFNYMLTSGSALFYKETSNYVTRGMFYFWV